MTEVSSQDTIIVLVGGTVCVIAVVFLVVRVCKNLLRGECCSRCLARLRQCCRCFRRENCQRRTENVPSSIQRSCRRLESLLSKQPELIIQNSDTEFHVGDTAQFQVTLPEPRSIFHSQQTPRSVQEHPTPDALAMNNQISIEIKKITGPPETISFIRELSVNPETNEDCINVKYTVRESGFYEIHVLHQNMHVTRSPQLQAFLPTEIDPVKTLLIRQSPTIVAFTFSPHTLSIEPKDRFGNVCRPDNFISDHFELKVTRAHRSNEIVEAMTYKFTTETTDEWGDVKLNIRLVFEVFVSGCFQGSISYENRPIGNPVFDLVTLTSEENELLSSMLKGPPDSVFFKGKLLASNRDVYKSPTDVFIYTSPKALVAKQFFLLLLPYRLGFYRTLPATKIELIREDNRKSTFTIRDRSQPKLTIEIGSTDFRVLLATFTHHLQQRLGGSESFENKQKLFHSELRLAREDKNRDFISVLVQRRNLIESTMAATRFFGLRDWCRKFRVEFEGEEGFDDGGLRRELLNLLCDNLFRNDANGLFCSMGTSRLVHPNAISSRSKYFTLRHYEFAGKVVGKCLFESSFGGFYQQMVNGRFSRSFLAHLIGSYPQHKHFEQDDPELHLRKVKYILENDVTPMELLFQEEEYDENGALIKTVELIPNRKGVAVTNENKEEYLGALAQFRLGTRVQSEIDAFLKGLHLIIPEGLLANFDENELEILMCGKSTFDIEDLKRNHFLTECGLSQNVVSKLLQWFWNSVEGMSTEERGRLLQFTTGSSLLPIGGFKELKPTFRITVTNNIGHLPIAHTCFSEICLSNHNSFEEFNKALLTAVNEGSEGFAMM